MAAKGSIAKGEITQKILSVFPGSFLFNSGKEIRVPIMENGEQIQIKVTLTAAKTNVEGGSDTALPGEVATPPATAKPLKENTVVAEVTEEEKQNVMKAMAALGL